MSDIPEVGCTEYTYTLAQLEQLKKLIELCRGDLSSALCALFRGFDKIPPAQEVLELWLRKAEHIKDNPNYIEELIKEVDNGSWQLTPTEHLNPVDTV